MEVIWFVGNGFDLSVGLKTGYHDFLDAYLHGRISVSPPFGRTKQEARAIRKGKRMMRLHMRKGIIDWSDMELALGKCTDEYVDTPESRADFTALRHDIEDSLSRYLRHESRMGEKKWIGANRNHEIASAFERVLENPPQGLEGIAKAAVEKLWARSGAETPVCRFVSFNYTDVFDRCLQIYRRARPTGGENAGHDGPAREVFHAHGTVDNAMVLGVSNYFQIVNNKLQSGELADGFVKTALYEGIEPNAFDTVKAMLGRSRLLIVTGMSVGSTDSHWWSLVGNWLLDYPESLVVIHWYRPGLCLTRGETCRREREKLDRLLCDAIGCGQYPLVAHRFLMTYNEPLFGFRLVSPPPESRVMRARRWIAAKLRQCGVA